MLLGSFLCLCFVLEEGERETGMEREEREVSEEEREERERKNKKN